MSDKPTGKIYDDFLSGAKRGVMTNLYIQIPNFVMAYVLIQVFNILGLLDILEKVLGPVMGIFGMPGAGAIPLVVTILSSSGAMGSAAALYGQNLLEPTHIVILIPMILLIGSQLQMMGRVLAVVDAPRKYYPHFFIINWINAIVIGLLMRLIINILVK
ncbi:MAG: hypothetical protein Q4G61_08815 [Tissierellia bacterium]|nr:hypothetical protein [Tissierellia bacterium]